MAHNLNVQIWYLLIVLLRDPTDPFLTYIVTCDEKWELYNNNNNKRSFAWLDKSGARKTFPKPEILKKIMVSVSWRAAGYIRYNFVKPVKKLTAEMHCHEIVKKNEELLVLRPRLVIRWRAIIVHGKA